MNERDERKRVRRETGKEWVVRVHYGEGIAIHIGPKPCARVREDAREASAGERIGQPSSRETVLIPGADAVHLAEALRGELTVSQLAAKHGVHQTMISGWKRQAMEGLSSVFSGRAEAKDAARDDEVEKLHAKIGQLLVERDFLAKASGR